MFFLFISTSWVHVVGEKEVCLGVKITTPSVPKEYELGFSMGLINKEKSKREIKDNGKNVSGEWGSYYYNGISVNGNCISCK